MKISKEELIEEITEQLNGLSAIVDLTPGLKLSETIAILDLQFRLKCKLYELTADAHDSMENQK